MKYAQFAVGVLALAAIVAGHALNWPLSPEIYAMLGSVIGWLGLRRPGDSPPELAE